MTVDQKVLDILKIQRTVRKSIKDYAIAGNHEEDALVALLSVDLYLALERDTPTPTKPKPKNLAISQPQI